MRRLCVFIILSCVFCVNNYLITSPVQWSIAQSFLDNEIVPDILPLAPAEYLTVVFPSGAVVDAGNELTPTLVKDRPYLSWNADCDLFYTIVNIDPDVPSRAEPTKGQVVHWVVGNVPGDDVASGDPLWEYFGAGPVLGTGLHRYVYVVYQQPSKLEFDEPRMPNTTAENRFYFSIANFAKKYNLGDPIAGNFYQAEYDDYVPIFYELLGYDPTE